MTDPVTRLNATLSGRYRIERQLGEGGMATVYLADDLKHERKVALKVLKPELAAVVGAERFLAEIKTTANLQHPHILPLHDSGEADGFLFYVMPYVEGETLRQKIDRERQLSVEESLEITKKVASALDYAHDHKIVHRDIKPGNILLSERGEPTVADFGIALAVAQAGGGRVTETGLSLGTPHYMSPEQATGDRDVDSRTDVYALGCVLYEMLTGDPPYQGSSAQAVLGQILAGDPVWASKKRASVPANVDAAIRKALEKLPADRFTGAQEFAKALADPGFRHGYGAVAGAAVGVGLWNRLSLAMTAVAALATLAFAWAVLRPEPPLSVERFIGPFGNGQEPTFTGTGGFNLSPDGSLLVYRGFPEGGGGQLLLVRRWDDVEPSPIRGTEGGNRPAVSPDGQEVAFEVGGEVKVVSLQGGPIRTLTTGLRPNWGTDGYIYANANRRVVRVPATGGPPEPVTEAVESEVHVVTDILPGDDVALLHAAGEVRALRLETGEMRALVPGTFGRYADSGHLVYRAPDGTLMAARFDPDATELLGPSVGVVQGVSAFSISDAGKLFFSRGASGGRNEFVWITRSGAVSNVSTGETFVRPPTPSPSWRLSPNGTRIAFEHVTDGNLDVWTKELPDGPMSRLTFSERMEYRPNWTPDGRSITFASRPVATTVSTVVLTQRADGTAQAELVYSGPMLEGAWSPDGTWLVLRTASFPGQDSRIRDILALRPGVDSVAMPLLVTEQFIEQAPSISRDGRWLAYSSNQAGSDQIFVQPFPNVIDGKWQVSTDGGVQPVWAHNGRELFFVNPATSEVMAAEFTTTGNTFRRERLMRMFTIPVDFVSVGNATARSYDVAPDDQRFLMARAYQGDTQEEAASSRFILVQNFFEELKRLVPN